MDLHHKMRETEVPPYAQATVLAGLLEQYENLVRSSAKSTLPGVAISLQTLGVMVFKWVQMPILWWYSFIQATSPFFSLSLVTVTLFFPHLQDQTYAHLLQGDIAVHMLLWISINILKHDLLSFPPVILSPSWQVTLTGKCATWFGHHYTLAKLRDSHLSPNDITAHNLVPLQPTPVKNRSSAVSTLHGCQSTIYELC